VIDKVKLPKKELKVAAGIARAPKPAATEEVKWSNRSSRLLEFALRNQGPQRTARFLAKLTERLREQGVEAPRVVSTLMSIRFRPTRRPHSGQLGNERRIKKCYVRWNAMAMVVNATATHRPGRPYLHLCLGRTLYEVAFNHFLRARRDDFIVTWCTFRVTRRRGFTREHSWREESTSSSCTISARSSRRRRLASLSASLSHAGFLAVPDSLDGVGPAALDLPGALQSLPARARLYGGSRAKVWAFIGDGETDEPETLGLVDAGRARKPRQPALVINCNLQRLDGPVRGNGKIIQELEAVFQGAGWNVIKLIWGSDWDPLLAAE